MKEEFQEYLRPIVLRPLVIRRTFLFCLVMDGRVVVYGKSGLYSVLE